MENQTNEVNQEELNAAVETAEAALETAVETEKASRERVKLGKKNLKATNDYLATLEEGTDAHAEYAGNAQQWQAEVDAATEANNADKEAVKAARAALKDAKKAAKGEKPKSERIEQNGQVKPTDDSRSGQMWAIFDAATAERGSTCAIADVLEQCTALGVTEGSARSAYSHWRKFHGVATGRIVSLSELNMSAEKRAEKLNKVREQLSKAEEKVAKLREQLNELEALEAQTAGSDETAEEAA